MAPAVGTVLEGGGGGGGGGLSAAISEPEEVVREREGREERRLAIMTMNKKRKRLYDKIMWSRKRKATEVKELKRRRLEHSKNTSSTKSKAP